PGIEQMLAQLNDLGIRYAVLTNRGHTRAERLLRRAGLSHIPIVSRERTGFQKQSGGLHTAAAELLGLPVHELVSVGDTKQDSIGAVQVRMLPFGAAWATGTGPPYSIPLSEPGTLIGFL